MDELCNNDLLILKDALEYYLSCSDDCSDPSSDRACRVRSLIDQAKAERVKRFPMEGDRP